MSDGTLETAEEIFLITPEQLREMRILINAQDVIPDYFTEAIRRASAGVSDDSDADDAEKVWEALLDDLDLEMARRAQ